MKKSQLTAISYAYARRERERIAAELETLGLKEFFELQTLYKTPRGFLAAYKRKSKKALSAIYEARAKEFNHVWSFGRDFSNPCRKKAVEKLLRIDKVFNELRLEIYPEKGKKGAKNEK